MTDQEAQVELGPAIPELTPQEITDLARDIVTNQVFITSDFYATRQSFLVVALARLEQIPRNIGACYEYLSKAGPMAVNGMPVFFSVHFVPEESMPALWDEMVRMRTALGFPTAPDASGVPPESAVGQNEGHVT